ncbi:MAG TPA: sulfite exporter TauE/SafE family protein [Candidatus Dormibacteraeota bacterium]|nr:sulfite exporter TauE/SafE family protein [Candidatus Dormibacteraeota bacterium]
MIWLALILLGLVAGAISGLVGIGGGVVIVPALVVLFGFSQKLAQGTTLALLVPPIGILAVIIYYKQGNVNLTAAGLIAVGFIVGSLLGARYVSHLSDQTVTRIFGVLLLAFAVKLLISARV